MSWMTNLLLASLLLPLSGSALWAQTPAPAAAQPTLPPAGVRYRYWPEQFVQWLGDDLPYSMIVLYVDNRPKQPVYDVEFIDRATNKPIHYANTPDQVALDKAMGFPTYLVRMAFDGPATPEKGAQYLLRFETEKDVPVLWQFVQGTDVSDQGGGLTPVQASVPVIVYREQGALAGEGTALKFGNITDTAGVWNEYAQPPYFVPYHGAVSVGIHILSFTPGDTTWKPGGGQSSGTLTTSRGMTLTVSKDPRGTSLADAPLGVTISLEDTGGALSRSQFGPTGEKQDHTVSLVFTPPLAAGVASRFEVVAGKKAKLAKGVVNATATPGGLTTDWTFDSPDFLKGKAVRASAVVTP